MTVKTLTRFPVQDFTPGIWTRNNFQAGATSAPPPPGAAMAENTHRCIALPAGGLGPLPRRISDISIPQPTDWGSNLLHTIGGFDAKQGVVLVDPAQNTSSVDRSEIHFTLQYLTATEAKCVWYRYRIFDTVTTTLETIHTETFTASSMTKRYTPFVHTRMNPADPNDPDSNIVTVSCWASNPLAATERWCKAFPDPSSPGTVSTIDVGDPTNHGYTDLYAHQGRVVLSRHLQYPRGPDAQISITDNWYWTGVNDNALSSATASLFVLENPQGIADAISLSANEFVVVKSYGGGFFVRGDLDNPTVIQLPNLHSPNKPPFEFGGCVSPKGWVYCGPNGAYLWSGGDTSTHISPQLNADFFATSSSLDGKDGQASRFGDYTILPNNWLWNPNMPEDTLGSWWRLEDPSDVQVTFWSDCGFRNQLYGSTHEIDNTGGAGDLNIFWKWRWDQPAYSWSWQSHPLTLDTERVVEVQEVLVVVQGDDQRLTITLTNESGDTTSRFVDFNSPDYPTTIRVPFSLTGKNFRVRFNMDGTATDGNDPAGILHVFDLGFTTHAIHEYASFT